MRAMLSVAALVSLLSPACILSPSETATINTDRYVRIVYVDGKETGFGVSTVNVKPGHHQIVPCLYVSYECLIGNALEMETKAGHTYTIKHQFEKKMNVWYGDKVTYWVEENK